jgi:hypothetical protein
MSNKKLQSLWPNFASLHVEWFHQEEARLYAYFVFCPQPMLDTQLELETGEEDLTQHRKEHEPSKNK